MGRIPTSCLCPVRALPGSTGSSLDTKTLHCGTTLALSGSVGVRVEFAGRERKVIDGPFAETKELLGGYWLWQVRSMEEAIEWVRRIPNPTGEHGVVEVRPVFEADDFGEELTPELREREERLRAQSEARA